MFRSRRLLIAPLLALALLSGAAILPVGTATSASAAAAPTVTNQQWTMWGLYHSINAERVARGLAPVQWHAGLAQSAQQWSDSMAAAGRMSHGSPQLGQGNLVGIDAFAENLFEADQVFTVDYLHRGWMASGPHRQNILQPDLDTVGIGVTCANGRSYLTQQFGHVADGSAVAFQPVAQDANIHGVSWNFRPCV